MAPCLDDEVEREAVQLYQLPCPVLEGGGPAVLLGCALEVCALWPRYRIATLVFASDSYWFVVRSHTPL